MTITVTARIEPIREPLRAEMHQAFDRAMTETDPFRHRYYAGLGIGYAVAFGLVTRDALDKARMTPFSVPLDIDFWRPSFYADEDSAWASGVRRGYWMGTSEHPHADECALCGERIITEVDDYEVCFDGVFCAADNCKYEWHRSGPAMCKSEGEED